MINRGADKKKVVFLRDISEKMQFSPNEEFTRLWRSVAVTDMDDNKIEEYLYKTGFAVNQGQVGYIVTIHVWPATNTSLFYPFREFAKWLPRSPPGNVPTGGEEL